MCTCELCRNGYVYITDDMGTERAARCSCMRAAWSRKLLRDSGLETQAERYTFENFKSEEVWQKKLKELATEYAADKSGSFFVSGNTGAGKTHICTAICNELLKKGKGLRYFRWVEDGTRFKRAVNDTGEYANLQDYINADILYIDDLFKQSITDADIRLSYELINSRYISGKRTIVSTERDLTEIKESRDGAGNAIAGRIYEMCGNGKYCVNLSGEEKNQRFKSAQY